MGWSYFLEGEGDSVMDKNNPGQPGQYTGRRHKAGPHMVVQQAYPGGRMSTRPLVCLEPLGENRIGSIETVSGRAILGS